jgi:hypothetical protein
MIPQVLHQRHKTEVHVQLLMAVKKRVPWIVRREVHFDGLIGVDDHLWGTAFDSWGKMLGQASRQA